LEKINAAFLTDNGKNNYCISLLYDMKKIIMEIKCALNTITGGCLATKSS